MDPNVSIFIIRHVVDIIIIIIFGVKVLFISRADLKTKFIGAVMLCGVVLLGEFLRTEMVTADTSLIWTFAIAIGLRLLALKIIFTVIDAEA